MKYTLGKIKFKDKKGGDIIPEFYSESDGIPSDLLITEGYKTLHSSYKHAMIVAFYDKYYVVEYRDKNNKIIRLGFLEDVLEPYEELQAYTGKFKKGDKVKVVRKAKSKEGDWILDWISPMTDFVNKTVTIEKIVENVRGYSMVEGYVYPEFVLEKVETNSNLELTRNKYKKGMVVRSVRHHNDYTINSEPFKEIDGYIYGNNGGITLFYAGEWAEIISKPVTVRGDKEPREQAFTPIKLPNEPFSKNHRPEIVFEENPRRMNIRPLRSI